MDPGIPEKISGMLDPEKTKKEACKCPTRILSALNIELNGRTVPALLDTGTTHTLVAKRALDDRNFQIKPTGRIGMAALGTVEVEFNVGGKIVAMECVAEMSHPLDPFAVTIGMDLLTKFRTLRMRLDDDNFVEFELVGYDPTAVKPSDLKLDLNININGIRPVNAILDTGVGATLIKKSVMADLIESKAVAVKPLGRCECNKVSYGANGFPLPIQQTVDLNLNINSEEFKQMECEISEVLPCEMIVGMNLLSKFRIIEVDFHDNGNETIRFLERRPEPMPTPGDEAKPSQPTSAAAFGQPQRNKADDPCMSMILESGASGSHGNEAKPNQPKPPAADGKDNPEQQSTSSLTQPAADKKESGCFVPAALRIPELKSCRCPARIVAHLNVDLNGRTVKALLDTGCSKTIVAKTALDPSTDIEACPRSFANTLSGPALVQFGLCTVQLNVGGSEMTIRCRTNLAGIDLSTEDIILGMDLLTKFCTLRLHFDDGLLQGFEFIGFDPAPKPRTLKQLDIDVNINGVELVEAFMDSGCHESVVKTSVIEKLLHTGEAVLRQNGCPCNMIVGASGWPMPVRGLVDLNVSLEGSQLHQQEFQVSDSMNSDLLIGMNLLSKFRTIEVNFCDCGDETIRFLERHPEPMPTPGDEAKPSQPTSAAASGQPQRNKADDPCMATMEIVPESGASGSHGNEAKPNQPKPPAADGKDNPEQKSTSNPTQPAADKKDPEKA